VDAAVVAGKWLRHLVVMVTIGVRCCYGYNLVVVWNNVTLCFRNVYAEMYFIYELQQIISFE